jgi:hypothetical protein
MCLTSIERGFLALLVVTSLGACADRSDPIAGIPEGGVNGLYPQLVIAGSSSRTPEVRISLLSKPGGVRLGSYQAEFRYDPAVLRFEGGSLPSGVAGAVNLVAPGHLRFVGASLDGIADVPLAVLRFTRTGSIDVSSLELSIEEVAAGEDLGDLTGQVFRGPPLVGFSH